MKNYKPYYFNEKYEYKTYQKVGWDYEEVQSLSKIEEDKGTYMTYHTYSQWKIHIQRIFQGMRNSDDFLHWIIGKRNFWSRRLEVIKIAYIPLYIAGISIIDNVSDKNITFSNVLFYTAIVILFAWETVYYGMQRINFYDDVIKIGNKMNEETSKNE